LGMKGSISEFELGTMRTRMLDAARQKARRGELRISVPFGYLWHREVGLGLDPDLRMQEVIRLVFARFRECGSARQVLLRMTVDILVIHWKGGLPVCTPHHHPARQRSTRRCAFAPSTTKFSQTCWFGSPGALTSSARGPAWFDGKRIAHDVPVKLTSIHFWAYVKDLPLIPAIPVAGKAKRLPNHVIDAPIG
jgi:hypothetical protein